MRQSLGELCGSIEEQWDDHCEHTFHNYIVTAVWTPYSLRKMHYPSMVIKWAASWQNQQNDCAPSEDSDQPGYPLRKLGFLATHWVHREDCDQPGRIMMPADSMMCVFAGHSNDGEMKNCNQNQSALKRQSRHKILMSIMCRTPVETFFFFYF